MAVGLPAVRMSWFNAAHRPLVYWFGLKLHMQAQTVVVREDFIPEQKLNTPGEGYDSPISRQFDRDAVLTQLNNASKPRLYVYGRYTLPAFHFSLRIRKFYPLRQCVAKHLNINQTHQPHEQAWSRNWSKSVCVCLLPEDPSFKILPDSYQRSAF